MSEPTPEDEVHLIGGATPIEPPEEPFPPTPFLAGVFWLLGALEILAGIVICAGLWPGDPKEGYS
jgi:hypothetical protein